MRDGWRTQADLTKTLPLWDDGRTLNLLLPASIDPGNPSMAVVVLVNEDTARSEYVQFEWSCARALGIPVIPVTWGRDAPLPEPWEPITPIACSEDGSDALVKDVLAAMLSLRNPPCTRPHDLILVCGPDNRSRLITKLAKRHAERGGLRVWSNLETLVPGLDRYRQLEEAIANGSVVALAVSPESAACSSIRHAAGWAYGARKPIVVLHASQDLGDPWPYLSGKKFLDFSGDFEQAWPAFQQALRRHRTAEPSPSLPVPASNGWPTAFARLETGPSTRSGQETRSCPTHAEQLLDGKVLRGPPKTSGSREPSPGRQGAKR